MPTVTLNDAIHSDQGLMLLGTVLGGLWSLFKSTELYARIRRRRCERALLALEAGVMNTYETYVREIKTSREDGKLTAEERREARRRAKNYAIDLARTEGLDIARELGHTYLDAWIERLVRKLKS